MDSEDPLFILILQALLVNLKEWFIQLQDTWFTAYTFECFNEEMMIFWCTADIG
jgi:hypothetical protein